MVKKGFPDYPIKRIEFADVVKGLPLAPHSAKVVYCSHVLEHLNLSEFRIAIRNVRAYLQPGGKFRIVVPDLEYLIKRYVGNPDHTAACVFLDDSYLGIRVADRGIDGLLRMVFGRSKHFWMWDYKAMEYELTEAGYINVRRANFDDSDDIRFAEVEDFDRWENCIGVECRRP